MSKLAIIQIRGTINTTKPLQDSFRSFNLQRKNSCVIVENSPEVLGRLLHLKDYVTWGEIDEETLAELLRKRGRLAGNTLVSDGYFKEKIKTDINGFAKSFMEGKMKIKDVPGLKRFFRLTAPLGGFERNGIKVHYSLGGSLGYRKQHINTLIRKMW